MYHILLSEDQRLEASQRSHERGIAVSTRDRLEMVRLSDAGWSVPRIAKHLRQQEKTVRFWIKAFLMGGFDGLASKPRGGKTSALTGAMLVGVREAMKDQRTFTGGQVREWVSKEYGVTLSVGRIRVHLGRAGLSCQRTSRDLRHKQKPEETGRAKATLQTLEKGGTAV